MIEEMRERRSSRACPSVFEMVLNICFTRSLELALLSTWPSMLSLHFPSVASIAFASLTSGRTSRMSHVVGAPQGLPSINRLASSHLSTADVTWRPLRPLTAMPLRTMTSSASSLLFAHK